MNLSGQSVAAVMQFYKILIDDVLVLHDELDLPPGQIKFKTGGGHAGHNGLRSLHAHIGPDYHRLRIGIGHPGDKNLVSDYVLHPFAKSDQIWIEAAAKQLIDLSGYLAQKKWNDFMSRQGGR